MVATDGDTDHATQEEVGGMHRREMIRLLS